MTEAEVAHAISNAIGKTVSYMDIPADAYRSANLGAGAPEWVVDNMLGLERIKASGLAGVFKPGVKDVLWRARAAPSRFLCWSSRRPATPSPATSSRSCSHSAR